MALSGVREEVEQAIDAMFTDTEYNELTTSNLDKVHAHLDNIAQKLNDIRALLGDQESLLKLLALCEEAKEEVLGLVQQLAGSNGVEAPDDGEVDAWLQCIVEIMHEIVPDGEEGDFANVNATVAALSEKALPA